MADKDKHDEAQIVRMHNRNAEMSASSNKQTERRNLHSQTITWLLNFSGLAPFWSTKCFCVSLSVNQEETFFFGVGYPTIQSVRKQENVEYVQQ